jgi:beta-phosphoglucomutase-like phosphatase (HAD superfamily)
MKHFDTSPDSVAIFEDSPVGLAAAYASDALFVEPVRNRKDIWFDRILRVVEDLNEA